MSRRTRNLAAVIAAVAALTITASTLLSSIHGPDAQEPAGRSHKTRQAVPTEAEPSAERTSYAISLAELSGLPRDARPGTVVDLWVTWDPPLTKRPKVQPLIRGAIVEKMAPAVVPGSLPDAILSVPERQVPRLIYGDRYGSLSATVRS